jgi:salicylate hydroxylase
MITFPVDHGSKFNLVAFFTSSEAWNDDKRLVRTARRDDALRDFAAFGSDVQKLLELTAEELDVVRISTFARGAGH